MENLVVGFFIFQSCYVAVGIPMGFDICYSVIFGSEPEIKDFYDYYDEEDRNELKIDDLQIMLTGLLSYIHFLNLILLLIQRNVSYCKIFLQAE